MAAIFGPDPQGRAGLDAETRDRVEQWVMPGFTPWNGKPPDKEAKSDRRSPPERGRPPRPDHPRRRPRRHPRPRLASFPFEDERERLAEMTDEELPLAAPLLRGSEDQFSPDQARERVGGWKSRRDGEDGKLGWQSAAERVDSAFGLMGSIIFGSCDRF